MDFDVVIVGGGIAGASLGAEIAGQRRTLIVEAEEYCGFHSTGRSAAFWLESYGGPKVSALSGASRPFLEAPPAHFSESGFLRTRGAVHLGRDEQPESPEGVESRPLDREELHRLVPGIRLGWHFAVYEPGCADIDVAALHAAYLRQFKKRGGRIETNARLDRATLHAGRWAIRLDNGETVQAGTLVNAAGAWADDVANRCGARPLGIAPKRRTMVQLKVGRRGLKDIPLVDDAAGTFYFKGESDSSIWLTPHDEIATDPCDAAPEEIDVATAIDRFEQVVDWPIERVERRWAGLRSFAPDRLPVYGFATEQPGFFWCAGQGGFGIQTAPAAAKLASSMLLETPRDSMVAEIEASVFSPRRFA